MWTSILLVVCLLGENPSALQLVAHGEAIDTGIHVLRSVSLSMWSSMFLGSKQSIKDVNAVRDVRLRPVCATDSFFYDGACYSYLPAEGVSADQGKTLRENAASL